MIHKITLLGSIIPIIFGMMHCYDALLEPNKSLFIASMLIYTGGLLIFMLALKSIKK